MAPSHLSLCAFQPEVTLSWEDCPPPRSGFLSTQGRARQEVEGERQIFAAGHRDTGSRGEVCGHRKGAAGGFGSWSSRWFHLEFHLGPQISAMSSRPKYFPKATRLPAAVLYVKEAHGSGVAAESPELLTALLSAFFLLQ